MSVIKQTGQAPDTIDSRPMCECDGFVGPCDNHPGQDVVAIGKYRARPDVKAPDMWFCATCVGPAPLFWERIS